MANKNYRFHIRLNENDNNFIETICKHLGLSKTQYFEYASDAFRREFLQKKDNYLNVNIERMLNKHSKSFLLKIKKKEKKLLKTIHLYPLQVKRDVMLYYKNGVDYNKLMEMLNIHLEVVEGYDNEKLLEEIRNIIWFCETHKESIENAGMMNERTVLKLKKEDEEFLKDRTLNI